MIHPADHTIVHIQMPCCNFYVSYNSHVRCLYCLRCYNEAISKPCIARWLEIVVISQYFTTILDRNLCIGAKLAFLCTIGDDIFTI